MNYPRASFTKIRGFLSRLFADFKSTRHVGLDLVRAIAILSVLASHSRMFWGDPQVGFQDTLWITFGGLFGVELFFVISGYLIGAIVLKVAERSTTATSLGTFWFRRWMRTLPLYYCVLAFVFVQSGFFGASYLVFLQNIAYEAMPVFPVSWSLVLEEWFYLIFPILLFAFAKVLGVRRGSLCAILVVYVAAIGLRYAQYRGFHAFGSDWRKFTFRLDNLALGVMLAWIRAYQPGVFEALRRNHIARWGAASLLLASIVWFYQINIPHFCLGLSGPSVLTFVLWPSWVGIACMAVVLAFAVNDFRLNKWVVHFVTFVSATSYSVYLVHLIVFNSLWQLGAVGAGFQPLALALALTYGISFGTYLLIERPIMVLRDVLSPHQTQNGLGLALRDGVRHPHLLEPEEPEQSKTQHSAAA